MEEHRKLLIFLARAGYGARGVVYLIIGGLAAMTALQEGGATTDSKGAMQVIDRLPGGDIMLGIIAAGLVGYSIWRFFQAVLDADDHGSDPKGLAIRSALFVSAVIHLGLALFAIQLATALGGGGSGKGMSGLTATLMEQPWGRWLVGMIGAAIILAGIANCIKGIKSKYRNYMSFGSDMGHWAHLVCRFGLNARGAVFVIIGFFFIYAAWTFDPDKARGLGGALAALQSQTYGMILLLIIALGLVAFGIYSIFEMFYRRIHPES